MYQALYRKYRPKSFSDVYGQDHVISTLKNEINENRISHAYLFTGSRGTGKTTCAKILAKAVNCENSIDGEPCNECEVCRGLDSGAIYDVVEIDAASNNGVDNIRDLREEANYTPTRGRYRVYIIDEVHMLSAGAFNALLKTLEEPPAHVIFILATTEVHKLPATILSRCQRFDFKRIQPETMAVRLKEVASLEGMELNDDAAVLIARIADGALRDGLSILDQCASRSKTVTSELVSEVAGLAGREILHKLADCVSSHDSSTAINLLSNLYQNSYDMERLCVEMINHFRNYLIVKTVNKSRELIICTDDEYNSIVDGAKKFTLEGIIFALDLFQMTLGRIKSGVNSRIEMEMSFVRLCDPRLEENNQAILDRLSQLERTVKNGVSTQTVSQPAKTQTPVEPQPQVEPQEAQKTEPSETVSPAIEPPVQETEPKNEPAPVKTPAVEPEPQPAIEPTNAPVYNEPMTISREEAPVEPQQKQSVEFDQWAEFMDIIHKTDIALFGVLNGSSASIVGEHFVIDSPNPTIKEFIKISTHAKAIRNAVESLVGRPLKLAVAKKVTKSNQNRDKLEDLINQAMGSVDIKYE